MKKGSFAGLVYRDIYLIRKPLITGLIMFALFAAFGWLLLLSFNYGNIGKILHIVMTDPYSSMTEEAEAALANIRRSIFGYMKFFPAVMAMQLLISTVDIAAKDTLVSWNRYLRCTPVTPLRFASVRVTVNLLCTAASFMLSVSYMLLIGLISGEYMTYGEFALFMMILTVIFLFSAVGQIFIALLRNRDKGMLASLAVIMITIYITAWNNRDSETEDGFDTLMQGAESICPFTPLILAAAAAVLLSALYLIYKRREK